MWRASSQEKKTSIPDVNFNSRLVHHLDYEELIEHVEELKELSSSVPIIVEGKNDEEALRSLGVEAEYHWISIAPFHEFCDAMAKHYDEVILFTDMDSAGRELARRLKAALTHRGLRVHDKFRPLIMGKLDTHHVEDIFKRFTRAQEELMGSGLWS